MSKIQTPDWILKGKEKPKLKKTTKTFKIRKCPKCGSDKVSIVLVGEEGKKADNWECRQCKWTGKDIKEEELSEDEFLKQMEGQEK
jgi:transcription elongation factor Elf1